MNYLKLFTLLLLAACGTAEDEDKDKIPPRLVAFNVLDDSDPYTGSRITVEGRISTETTGQFIAYEISVALSEKDPGTNLDCTNGDQVKVFYQEEHFDVKPNTVYYLVGCAMNKKKRDRLRDGATDD